MQINRPDPSPPSPKPGGGLVTSLLRPAAPFLCVLGDPPEQPTPGPTLKPQAAAMAEWQQAAALERLGTGAGILSQAVGAVNPLAGLALGVLSVPAAWSLVRAIEHHQQEDLAEKLPTKAAMKEAPKELKDIIDELPWRSGLEFAWYSQATSGPFRFPPGHPLPGRWYRLHPLAPFPGCGKGHTYIPVHEYDDLLFAEREAELVRLLVDLGATRIVLERKTGANTEAGAKGSVGLEAAGGLSASLDGNRAQSQRDTRTFTLRGTRRPADHPIERARYGWLPFEPAWEALVFAREVGGCQSASLELTRTSSFSLQAEAGLKEGWIKNLAQAEASLSGLRARDQSWLVQVEFWDPDPSAPSKTDEVP